jgi:hypothetical protein
MKNLYTDAQKQIRLALMIRMQGELQVIKRRQIGKFLPPAQKIDWDYLSEFLDNTPINTIKSWLRTNTNTKQIQGVPLSKVKWIENKLKEVL